jgi:release factor glutamine methyltransferase
MTVADILNKYAQIEIDLLLGQVLKKSKEFLYLHPDIKLAPLQQQKLTSLVQKRKKGVPIAYLLGFKYFYGLLFKVTKDVLIPRPESEWLIDESRKIIGRRRNMKIIDVGTGSGCLAISLAKYSPAQIQASDVSVKALAMAKQNAKSLNADVQFFKRSLLSGDKNRYDLIIANLPYVPAKAYEKFHDNLKYEPKLALVDGQGDMFLIRQLIDQLDQHLKKNGTTLLEIDPSFAKPLQTYIKSVLPQKKVLIVSDINNLSRFIKIY